MQDAGYGLPRTPLPRTPVNNGAGALPPRKRWLAPRPLPLKGRLDLILQDLPVGVGLRLRQRHRRGSRGGFPRDLPDDAARPDFRRPGSAGLRGALRRGQLVDWGSGVQGRGVHGLPARRSQGKGRRTTFRLLRERFDGSRFGVHSSPTEPAGTTGLSLDCGWRVQEPRGRREGDLRGWPRQEGSPGGERLQGVGLGRTYRAGVLLWAPAIFVPRRPPATRGAAHDHERACSPEYPSERLAIT
jgi:hypothetical protein